MIDLRYGVLPIRRNPVCRIPIHRPPIRRILNKYIVWVNAVVLWKKIVLRIFNYIFSPNFLLL